MVKIHTLTLIILVGILLCFCTDSTNGVVKKVVQYAFRYQALQAAKRHFKIPRGQQPVNTVKVPERNSREMLRQYNYINNQGKPISIRQDNPRKYGHPQGHGDQGPHFNAGPTGSKLEKHFNFDNFNKNKG
ncbi:unnamed protein product [Adineta steineri]|uniref:HNH/Endo VII superfamily nuclease toxins domain-containing protein n=1 Tax=Adineta steineri TaxID=433720 RepID=A0A813UGP3_9BILA|nr:unnamed protein product [Adineta steineri]CAF4215458.1 unnamed protein product [Adineta steineri]